MSKNLRIAIGLLGLSVLLLPARRLLGIEIAPATARDIKYALGPDASGLRLSQESLPDLFALTASRIEESPKQFTVEQPYTSGRWKGGKAVIEYARDLSYTLVSVYDKDGHRQRIYSVRTAFSSHAAPQEAKAAPSEQEPTESNQGNEENAGWEKPAARNTRTQTASSGEAPSVGYEWDE